MQIRRRPAALFALIVGGLWLLAGLLAPAASAAPAATGDVVDSMTIDYEVTPDGILKVREEITYRFGVGSGRHGIYRDLVVREPLVDDDSKDQRYDVSQIAVESPSGASAEFATELTRQDKGRYQTMRIKIGSADEIITDPTATYVISYQVRGALRHFDDHSELYWDATGNAWEAPIRKASISVAVPGGVTEAKCFAGRLGSTTPCDAATVSAGNARFTQDDLSQYHGVTIVAAIKAGQVSNDTPILDDPPNIFEQAGIPIAALGVSGLVTLLAGGGAVAYRRRSGRDDRYAGLPPGSSPAAGSAVRAVPDSLREDQIPVAFAPPRGVPVAEAGLLLDAVANTQETAATLIDLAVRGAIRIDNTGETPKAVLVDNSLAEAPHERELLRQAFTGASPGSRIELKRRKVGDHSMRRAHDKMIRAVRSQVEQRGWYKRMPSAARGKRDAGGGLGCACAVMVAIWVFGGALMGGISAIGSGGTGYAIAVGVPALAVAAFVGTWLYTKAKGQRSADGRAAADQVVGFRTYLATAEADQLKFEEGEDIFSRYLPWAIVFGLADRWQRVCAQLAAAGRIPPEPGWYVGPSYYGSGFAAGSISDSVARTFDPPPAPASSGSSGGGGFSSGFSGGSSGGGGGGGGGGSW